MRQGNISKGTLKPWSITYVVRAWEQYDDPGWKLNLLNVYCVNIITRPLTLSGARVKAMSRASARILCADPWEFIVSRSDHVDLFAPYMWIKHSWAQMWANGQDKSHASGNKIPCSMSKVYDDQAGNSIFATLSWLCIQSRIAEGSQWRTWCHRKWSFGGTRDETDQFAPLLNAMEKTWRRWVFAIGSGLFSRKSDESDQLSFLEKI